MSLNDINTIDAIGTERNTGQTILTLADAWDWNNEQAHLLQLQAKLSSYFDFIECGQIWQVCPEAKAGMVTIDVVTRYPLSIAGQKFIEIAADTALELGITLRHRCLADH
jgi:hypothetical protein